MAGQWAFGDDVVGVVPTRNSRKLAASWFLDLLSFVVIKKPATKARKGTNPFNGEPMMFKAKPARKIVRARPGKAAKDAVCVT